MMTPAYKMIKGVLGYELQFNSTDGTVRIHPPARGVLEVANGSNVVQIGVDALDNIDRTYPPVGSLERSAVDVTREWDYANL
jgi:hypothetical protein